MDKEHVLTPRTDLRMRHYESVVERDHRLQMVRNPLFDDFQEIVILDKQVANGNKTVKSHPIAIYLNKSARCSRPSAEMNKNLIVSFPTSNETDILCMRRSGAVKYVMLNKQTASMQVMNSMKIEPRKRWSLIYERMTSIPSSNETKKYRSCLSDDMKYFMLDKQNSFIHNMDIMKIEPRKRWNKLYDRNPPYNNVQELLSVEISRNFFRKYKIASRCLIYRRCQLKSQHEEWCFPLIWNEPGLSNVIDEISGETLCHITLLCRDLICECNKCTTGCTTSEFSCDVCKVNLFSKPMKGPGHKLTGSFAENCMLPIFYVRTDENHSVKKWSDIDIMDYDGRNVGFDVNESNIFATIDTDASQPGYLQLRDVKTGHLLGWEKKTIHEEPGLAMGRYILHKS